jgi:hypothetical protein
VLARNTDFSLIANWCEFIVDENVLSAFLYLVGLSASIEKYTCEIRWKGKVRDFRYLTVDRQQPFSFITNTKWLLFYFRAPAVRSGRYSGADLSELFESFHENRAGEWTVKLRTIVDVNKLSVFLRWNRD